MRRAAATGSGKAAVGGRSPRTITIPAVARR
jgi:hypothetical protein